MKIRNRRRSRVLAELLNGPLHYTFQNLYNIIVNSKLFNYSYHKDNEKTVTTKIIADFPISSFLTIWQSRTLAPPTLLWRVSTLLRRIWNYGCAPAGVNSYTEMRNAFNCPVHFRSAGFTRNREAAQTGAIQSERRTKTGDSRQAQPIPV